MNVGQVKREIHELGRSPLNERMYPTSSEWVPIADVLAIINRFEKHWENYKKTLKDESQVKLMSEIFG